MFLFAIYNSEPQAETVENGQHVVHNKFRLCKCSMQKILRGNEIAKRMPIDFDPLSKQMCFVVAGRYSCPRGGYVELDIVVPIAILDSEEEAEKLRASVQKTNGKAFAPDKYHKLERVEVHPALITTS